MNLGYALAGALGSAAQDEVKHMNEMERQEGLLARTMAQEAARDARLQQTLGNRTELAEMRLAAQGGGRSGTSGGGGKGASMGADEVMGIPGFTKASALAGAGVTDPEARAAVEFLTDPQKARARGASNLEDGPPQAMSDEQFSAFQKRYSAVMTKLNDHFARTQANWKDRNDGDTSNNNQRIAQGYLSGELSKDRADAAVGMNVGKPVTEPKDLSYQKANDFTRREDILRDDIKDLRKNVTDATSPATREKFQKQLDAAEAELQKVLAGRAQSTAPQFTKAQGAPSGTKLPSPRERAEALRNANR